MEDEAVLLFNQQETANFGFKLRLLKMNMDSLESLEAEQVFSFLWWT